MAAFQFTVQQVSFPSEELPDDSSSVDSLSSVVDPNVDFFSQNPSKGNDKENLLNFAEDLDEKTKSNSSDVFTKEDIYPTISLAVAHCINKNNPELVLKTSKYLNLEFLRMAQTDIQSEALALQQSVIGNMDVKPVSADVVAQVVANTKLRLEREKTVPSENSYFSNNSLVSDQKSICTTEQQNLESQNNLECINKLENGSQLLTMNTSCSNGSVKSEQTNSLSENGTNNCHNLNDGAFRENTPNDVEGCNKNSVPKLIRYPPESISSTVEKRSWFSSSSSTINSEHTSRNAQNNFRDSQLSSRSSSQNSINNLFVKKTSPLYNSSIPKVHSSKSSRTPKISNNNIGDSYDLYPDSSAEYETESSVSEKFEVESMFSETFETESNFSEVSGLDDEMFQVMKLKNIPRVSDDKLVHNGTQVGVQTSNVNTSPIRHIEKYFVTMSDKSVETDESYQFKLLREKANLEGRLEVVSQDQNSLVKERDNFRSLVNSLEAQVISQQKQLEMSISEKQNALKLLDSQNREQKSWDSVIKEYQNIIESKNTEIKGLKEDLSESEQETTRAKINFEELKVEMESKEGAISGLKKKMAEFHVEMQVLLQGKIQLENEVKNVRLEMETLQKSKEWFQEQLHATQESRNKMHQELIFLQSNLATTSNNLEKVDVEKYQLKQELIQLQERAIAEKEVLMKHLETIEADMKERESLFNDIQKDKGTAEAALMERIRKLEEEKSQCTNLSLALSDQEYQLRVLKSDCEEKSNSINAMKKEKVDFSRRIAVLQKSLNDKDMMNEQLSQQIKDLNVKIRHLEMTLSHSEELMTSLKDERTAMDVALASANEEKRVVNETLKSVSENLNKFKHNFKIMKADLVAKSSLAEQLLKEKVSLEEALKKSEDAIFNLQKEFEQQVRSDSQNRDVLVDDLKKKKTDVENVLNVYSKDLLNYQQMIEKMTKEKSQLCDSLSSFNLLLESERVKVRNLNEENISLKNRMEELEENLSEGIQSPEEIKKMHILLKTKKVLYKKLKEKMKECEFLKNELQTKAESFQQPNHMQDLNKPCEAHLELLATKKTVQELEDRLGDLQKMQKEQKSNQEVIIELEREKGKATGITEKYEALRQHLSELESKMGVKDSEIVQWRSEAKLMKEKLAELQAISNSQISGCESDLNKERASNKNLRQQIFQEKRVNSHTQRNISNMKSALEQANQIADSKKQEVESLQAELAVKVQAELKHRAEIEHFQTEIRLQKSIAEKITKELQEVKARDPALAEQIKAVSWKLKEKSNEVEALKEKLNLGEERNKLEIENIKKTLQTSRCEMDHLKEELKVTREEKFSYQAKVIELRKAFKSKLGELESKGIVRIENQASENGPKIHLNIPDPEVSFDETYVNELLQKSMHLSDSRPLSNLQECLNSLKEEMVQLQKKIMENTES